MTDLFEFESEEDLVPIVYEGPFVEQGEILFSYDMPDESKEATTKTSDWAGGDLGFDMNTEQPQNFEENEPSFPISNFAPSLSFNNNTIGASAAEDNSMMFTSNNNISPFMVTPNANSLSNSNNMSFNSNSNSNFRPNANSGMASFDEMPTITFSSNAPTYNNPGLFVNTNLPLNFNTGGTASFQQPVFNGTTSPTGFNTTSPTGFNTMSAPNFNNAGQASPSSFNRMAPNFNTGQASPTSFNSANPFGFRSNSSGNISFSTQNNFHFPNSTYPSDVSQVNSMNNINMMQSRVTNDINSNFMNVAPLSMNNSNSMSLFSNEDEMNAASAGYQGYGYTGMPGSLAAPPVRRVRSASSPANIYSVSNFSSVALAQQQHFPSSKSEAKLSLSADSGGPSYSSSGSNASADEFSDEFSFGDEAAEENELQILEIASKFTLPSSKSPIIEAMAFCAVHNWGISIVHSSDSPEEGARVIFLVKNFSQYCRFSRLICSKRHPTHNEGARIKALRRWFVKFPKKKERKSRESFILEVKPDYSQKVHQMIERYKHD